MDELNLNQLLNIAQLLAMVGGGGLLIFKVGSFAGSIKAVVENHEVRITRIEEHPAIKGHPDVA